MKCLDWMCPEVHELDIATREALKQVHKKWSTVEVTHIKGTAQHNEIYCIDPRALMKIDQLVFHSENEAYTDID